MKAAVKAVAVLVSGVSVLGLASVPADAQVPLEERERGVPVYERVRPELEPLGLRAGAFVIRPSLSLSETYNDNIYATRRNREDDFITTVTPRVEVASDWSRHQVLLDVAAAAGFYANNSSENFVDASALLRGRLDILRETFLTGELSHARLHEERGDPDVDLANDEPSIYHLTEARLAGYHGAGRLSLQLGANFSRYNYRSVDLVGGGSDSQSTRDHNIYEVESRVAYEVLPNISPFVQASYNWRRYDTRTPTNQDSEGFRVGLGTGFDAGGVITGEVFGGYMFQDYEASDRDNISGPWFGGSVLWNVTRLTSVQLLLERSVRETESASGYTRTTFDSRVDHELLRNLLIGAYFNYDYDSYEGRDVKDHRLEGGPRVTYLWNRNLSAELALTHRRLNSNVGDREYRENRALLMVTASF